MGGACCRPKKPSTINDYDDDGSTSCCGCCGPKKPKPKPKPNTVQPKPYSAPNQGGQSGAAPGGNLSKQNDYNSEWTSPSYHHDRPSAQGGYGSSGPGGGMGGAGGDTHKKIMMTLGEMAVNAEHRPPKPVYNSASYERSLEDYSNRCTVNSEAELDGWYQRELDALKHKSLDEMMQAGYSTMGREMLNETPPMDEYRLQLAALVHCRHKEKGEWTRRRMQRDSEREEDGAFLEGLKTDVKRNGMTRPDLLNRMGDYSQRCKSRAIQQQQQQRGGGGGFHQGGGAGGYHPGPPTHHHTGGYGNTYNGYPDHGAGLGYGGGW